MSRSSSSSTSSYDSEEETDVQDLKPMKGYLSNRRELARQLFKSVKSEKIRMMLPQILKNMSMSELEEWCASELYGMSEARILCILNGQKMVHSSDTSETDDSGPSLEIISDTEEWLTDTDMAIKEEPSSSRNSKLKNKTKRTKVKVQKKNEDLEKAKARTKKGNTTVATNSNVKVKQEKEKENRPSTNKEGESLLDLLELEMRARAIRALIRKEENPTPAEVSEERRTTTALRNTLNSAVSASFSDEKNLTESVLNGNAEDKNSKTDENVRRSAENGEDEDVVFVVAKTTPTIELLSSDGESEKVPEKPKKKVEENDAGSSNKKNSSNKNESVSEALSKRDTTNNERIVTIDKTTEKSENLKIVITKRVSESSGSPKSSKTKSTGEKGDKSSKPTSEKDKNTDKVTEPESSGGLFKKIRKKKHLRTKSKTAEEPVSETSKCEESVNPPSNPSVNPLVNLPVEEKTLSEENVNAEAPQQIPLEASIKLETPDHSDKSTNEIKSKIEIKRASARLSLDDSRLDDFEEIIDLDDYPDDMDEIESTEQVKKVDDLEQKAPQASNESGISNATNKSSQSAETWASRYYQTDDVQNVIKESKMQSEIRKRLRERQRISKLNSSPKLNSPKDSSNVPEKLEEKSEIKPTGSVQEYLALKNASVSNTEEITDDKKVPDENSPENLTSSDKSSTINTEETDPS